MIGLSEGQLKLIDSVTIVLKLKKESLTGYSKVERQPFVDLGRKFCLKYVIEPVK